MNVIYVDSLFLLNFIIDYLLLLISARLCSLRLRRIRYLLGAAVGGIYAVACFVPGLQFLTHAPMKLVLWGIMSLIAFGGETYLFKCALSFLVVSAAFGGGVWALSMFSMGGSDPNGFFSLDLRVLVLSFALCYAGLSLVFSGKLARSRREILSVSIILRGKAAHVLALRDTGNSLREPVSGKLVLVSGASTLASLFSDAEMCVLSSENGTNALLALSELEGAPRFMPVLFSALGTESGIAPAFTPDVLLIDGKEHSEYVVAVSQGPIGDGEFTAVI